MQTETSTPPAAAIDGWASPSLLWGGNRPALFCVAACCIVAFGPVLFGLGRVWIQDGDMSHGALAPCIAGWIVWERRSQLREISPRPNNFGLALIALAAMGVVLGYPSAWDSFTRFSLLLSIVGCILYLRGTAMLKALSFPLLLLAFMAPPPTFIYDEITLPLQLIASRLAETSLEWLGVSVLRNGNILELAGQKLSVAEACSGIRSLFSLCFFGLVYAYLFDRRTSMRWILLIAAAPIAILANSGRIVFTAIAGERHPEWVHGALHGFSGWMVFLIAALALAAFHNLLRFASPNRTTA